MGAWMARAGVERLGEADLIVPVPLRRFRLISRRFNQAALAHSVSQASVVPLDTQAADAAEADAAAGRAEPAPSAPAMSRALSAYRKRRSRKSTERESCSSMTC